MLRIVLTSAILLLGGVSTQEGQPGTLSEEAKKELAKLQGRWVHKEGQRDGEKFEINDASRVLEIADTKWIYQGVEKGEFIALYADADPKGFDLKSLEKGTKGDVHEGIYKIDGDTLTVCIYQGEQRERPTRFEATAEHPAWILVVLKRAEKK